MPSNVKGYAWFIRITLPHEILKEKIDKVNWIDLHSLLFIGHVGNKTEKEHGHMLLRLNSELQKQSIDVRIKNLFSVKGADYSSKPWDGSDSAGGYMFHDENYKLLANKGFSDDDIQRYVELNNKTQAVIAINKEKGANKNVEAVLEEYKGTRPARKEVCISFLRRIKEGLMYDPGDWKLKSMVEEVLIRSTQNEREFMEYAYDRLNTIYR